MKVRFTELQHGDKRMRAEFINEHGKKVHAQRFGFRGGETFVDHKDNEKKRAYLARHGTGNEDWNDKYSAGALSRWVLWSEPSLAAGKKHFAKKFGLTIIQ